VSVEQSIVDSAGLEVLDGAECLRLLASVPLGSVIGIGRTGVVRDEEEVAALSLRP
jgi:hypothetical protein